VTGRMSRDTATEAPWHDNKIAVARRSLRASFRSGLSGWALTVDHVSQSLSPNQDGSR